MRMLIPEVKENEMNDITQSTQPIVSIIVPIYNAQDFIDSCIKSVINQTAQNIELILINDGSKDNSAQICDSYAAQHTWIKVIHSSNQGPSCARNQGLESATGDFIFFLDADDSLEPRALELLLEKQKEHQPDMVIGNFNKVTKGNSDYGHADSFKDDTFLNKKAIVDYTLNYLKQPNRNSLFIYIWGKLYRTDIIKNNGICFNTKLHTFEDISFNFTYLQFVESAYYLKEPIYNYLIHDSFTSGGLNIYNNPVGHNLALNLISNFLKSNGINAKQVDQAVGHASTSLTIISMIRSCIKKIGFNLKYLYQLFSTMVNDPFTQNALKSYSPTGKESRILPILIKHKLILPAIIVCKYKANKRYGTRSK